MYFEVHLQTPQKNWQVKFKKKFHSRTIQKNCVCHLFLFFIFFTVTFDHNAIFNQVYNYGLACHVSTVETALQRLA